MNHGSGNHTWMSMVDDDVEEYIDDDLTSLPSMDTVSEAGEEVPCRETTRPSQIDVSTFSGFFTNKPVNKPDAHCELETGDCNGNTVDKWNTTTTRPSDSDAFGRIMPKGRAFWYTSEYGFVFRLMNGELLRREKTKSVRKATSGVRYIEKLYTDDSLSLAELSESVKTKDDLAWGTFISVEPDVWNLWNSEDELDGLTTLDVQRTVAATVNSRRRLKWSIGVKQNGMVTGVALTDEEKDILRQAIDFALAREFVPELDARVVRVEFTRVSAISGPNRYLVVISIDALVETLHQLSSGRIFYLIGDKVVMAENMNQIRLALEMRLAYDESVRDHGIGRRGRGGWAGWINVVVPVMTLAAVICLTMRSKTRN